MKTVMKIKKTIGKPGEPQNMRANSEGVLERGDYFEAGSSAWLRWNCSSWKESGNSPLKHIQCVSKVMRKRHLFSKMLCSLGSLYRKVVWGKREEHVLSATGNRYQLDLVEQALKIQFLDDEIRNHDDRIGKYHNNILGADIEDDDLLPVNE